jgi:ribonuclease HI
VILRDNEGKLIVAKSTTCLGYVEPAAAEAFAALEATQLERDMGYEQIHFMGDAKTVIDAVNSEEPDWSRIGHLISDICSNLQEFSLWKFSYVSRENNRTVHELARG